MEEKGQVMCSTQWGRLVLLIRNKSLQKKVTEHLQDFLKNTPQIVLFANSQNRYREEKKVHLQ